MSMIPFASDFGFPNSRRSNSIFDPFFVSGEFWDPFQSFNNLANNALSFPNSSFGETSQFASTRINWKETPEVHVFKADLPGIKKEEVKVEIEEGKVLQISGERSRESEEKGGDQWHRVERSSGSFLRRFRLPENVEVDLVKPRINQALLNLFVLISLGFYSVDFRLIYELNKPRSSNNSLLSLSHSLDQSGIGGH